MMDIAVAGIHTREITMSAAIGAEKVVVNGAKSITGHHRHML